MARPQISRFNFGLQRPHQPHEARISDIPLTAQQMIERFDFARDKVVDPI